METLRGKTAFVTGGTGFIGGRLLESLVTDHGLRVKALARGTGAGAGAFRAARFDIEFIHADITSENELTTALAGCDYIFHTAFGSHGSLVEQRNITVNGTAALLASAEKSGVERFINLSTATVYGTPQGASINETASSIPSKDWDYACDKWEAEKLVAASSLYTTTLRLGSVYGPRSPAFTISPIHELKTGRIVLPNNGEGLINAVYVDDVIQAILLATVHEEAVNETFLISGPDKHTTRREFYECYQKMLDQEARIVSMPVDEIRSEIRSRKWAATKSLPSQAIAALKQSSNFKASFRESHFFNAARKLINLKPNSVTATTSQLPLLFPQEFMLDYFCSTTIFDHSKASSKLGYSPQFNLKSGMALTEKWAHWARLLD